MITTTVEEIYIQPRSTVVEQQQQQPKQEDVTTTTEVVQQTLPQVTADASSTQPKTEQQVSDSDLAVPLCAVN